MSRENIRIIVREPTLSERFELIERGLNPSTMRSITSLTPKRRNPNKCRELSLSEKINMPLDVVIENEVRSGSFELHKKVRTPYRVKPAYKAGMTREQREVARLDADLENYFLTSEIRAKEYLDRDLDDYFDKNSKKIIKKY